MSNETKEQQYDRILKEECQNLCMENHLIEEAKKRAEYRMNKIEERHMERKLDHLH